MCPVMELPGLSTTSVLCPLSPECLSWPCIVSSQVFIDKFMLLILPLLPVLPETLQAYSTRLNLSGLDPLSCHPIFWKSFPHILPVLQDPE